MAGWAMYRTECVIRERPKTRRPLPEKALRCLPCHFSSSAPRGRRQAARGSRCIFLIDVPRDHLENAICVTMSGKSPVHAATCRLYRQAAKDYRSGARRSTAGPTAGHSPP